MKIRKIKTRKVPPTVKPQHDTYKTAVPVRIVNDVPYGRSERTHTNRGKFSVNDTVVDREMGRFKK